MSTSCGWEGKGRTEQNRTLLPQAKVLMAGCQNSQHDQLCWLPIMT